MTGLIDELREWKRTHYDSERMECGSKAFDEILSRYKAKSSVGNQDGGLREKLNKLWESMRQEELSGGRRSCGDDTGKEYNNILDDIFEKVLNLFPTHPIPQKAQEGLKEAVDRFLCWELPKDFMPDGGISYSPIKGHTPIGTNLLTATQAEQMFSRCLSHHPQSSPVKEEPYPDTVLISSEEKARLMVNDPLRNEIWEYKEELKFNGKFKTTSDDVVDDLEKILEKTGHKGE